MLVNVYNVGNKASEACAKNSGYDLKGKQPYEVFCFQCGRAGGYGYLQIHCSGIGSVD